jgi:tRNA threonylcarbamoyladenosine biosynthesis protein TsaE
MSNDLLIQSRSVDETLRIGRSIGEVLREGDVVGLVGNLGAGKTHLCKGIASGLGVASERLVNSPTFVIVNEYAGRVPVHHVDAYRLKDAAQLEAIGFEELCSSGGVVVVEWADRVSGVMPADALWLELTIRGNTDRVVRARTQSASLSRRLSTISLDHH